MADRPRTTGLIRAIGLSEEGQGLHIVVSCPELTPHYALPIKVRIAGLVHVLESRSCDNLNTWSNFCVREEFSIDG